MAALSAFCAAHAVKGLVMGLPLNLDGSDSPRTQSVRAFARNLQPLGLLILLWDERWSTHAVTRTLIVADLTSTRRAELVRSEVHSLVLLLLMRIWYVVFCMKPKKVWLTY